MSNRVIFWIVIITIITLIILLLSEDSKLKLIKKDITNVFIKNILATENQVVNYCMSWPEILYKMPDYHNFTRGNDRYYYFNLALKELIADGVIEKIGNSENYRIKGG